MNAAPRPLPSKTVIFDVLAAYVRPLGGWIAIAHLVTLLNALGVDEQTVRASVSRLTRKGLLVRASRAGQIGYQLTPSALALIAEGDQRIFAREQPADLEDGWVVAVFSVPERERDKRHQLRSRLTWLGFGNLGGGVWLAPRRVLRRAVAEVRTMHLEPYVDFFEAHHRAFGGPEELIGRCWDLPALDLLYADFIGLVRPVLARWVVSPASDWHAFVDFTTVLLRWRQIPYHDPGLPAMMLPPGWRGREAAQLFADLVGLLDKAARRYVESVVHGSDVKPVPLQNSSHGV